jgi:hypothetical protein
LSQIKQLTRYFYMLKNPLHEEPRSSRTPVIRSESESSLLSWLTASGRMVARETQAPEGLEEEPEISELIDVENVMYDIEDEEDLNLDE